MSETTWLFQKGGAIHSPATLANLRQLASNGAVTRDTPVWREGMTDYVEAEKVTELVDCFKPRTFHGHALR